MPGLGKVVVGVVKWYDASKGYGFVVADDGGGDILLHANVLRAHGYATAAEGSTVTLETQTTERGRQAVSILSLEQATPADPASQSREPRPTELVAAADVDTPLQPARVKWFDKVKGFGFVNVFGNPSDVFVHMEVLRCSAIGDLAPGEAVAVRIIEGPRGHMAAEVCVWERAIGENQARGGSIG
ncbi:cold-shock protein [Oceanicella sp. SM1341]|uniref:cold-shock protein n=1 Tax=Oceanicella sp. SM1341 TaxID=1548889 RepID=UPI001E57500A|nr:cold shock domain-containing protein [Oceanicella sp. SM1341]